MLEWFFYISHFLIWLPRSVFWKGNGLISYGCHYFTTRRSFIQEFNGFFQSCFFEHLEHFWNRFRIDNLIWMEELYSSVEGKSKTLCNFDILGRWLIWFYGSIFMLSRSQKYLMYNTSTFVYLSFRFCEMPNRGASRWILEVTTLVWRITDNSCCCFWFSFWAKRFWVEIMRIYSWFSAILVMVIVESTELIGLFDNSLRTCYRYESKSCDSKRSCICGGNLI